MTITNQSKLIIIVPCYNEEEILLDTNNKLEKVLHELIKEQIIHADSNILYVNDGSYDKTWSIIKQSYQTYNNIIGVNLAGNVGHQNALMAGLSIAAENCDMAISIDADLQDDIQAIKKMIIEYYNGYDIVYGVRNNRKTDTWFKRTTALAFYSLMKKMGIKSVYNHADFRLMSQRAIKQLLQYHECNLFLRGLIPIIGYKSTYVYYTRHERLAGKSKYPLKKMITLAIDGITSFSIKPIHIIFYLGISFLIISLCILMWIFYAYISHKVVPGWSSLMISIWFCSGCILVSCGITGEYIGKIYTEVKRRPRYNIEKILQHKK